jgi:RND family efflux transporter MFP subunit
MFCSCLRFRHAAVLASALAALLVHAEVPAANDQAGNIPFVPTSGATRGSFRSVLRPAIDVSLSARAAGVVDALNVPEGQEVAAGQAIISLDSDQEQAEVLQAEAAVRGTKAEMERATSELERMQSLREDKIYSDKQFLEAKAQAAQARSRFEQSEAGLQMARVRLANRTIKSPIAGIFLKTNKLVGEAVERYETVARVVDVTSLEMVVFCDARYFSLFKTGQHVDVRVFKSTEDQPVVTGLIVHKDPIIDPSSGTFRVKVKIERSEQSVPGLSAMLIAPAAEPIRSSRPSSP